MRFYAIDLFRKLIDAIAVSLGLGLGRHSTEYHPSYPTFLSGLMILLKSMWPKSGGIRLLSDNFALHILFFA